MKFIVIILVALVVAASLADTSSAFVVVHPVATTSVKAGSGRTSPRQHQQQKSRFIDTTATATATVLYKGMWTEDDEIQGLDRFKACVPYLLPLIDGHHFAKYICLRFPIIGAIDSFTIGPLADIADSIPFATLILFLILSLGTRNPEMSKSLRFSAQQAVLIDVSLILPELTASAFGGIKEFSPFFEPMSNFTTYYYLTLCIYSIASNIRGQKPDKIPYLSNLAQMAVGPF
jgi:hypothetical protein